MTVAAILLATLVVLRALAKWRLPWLLTIGVAAIPVGVVVATCTGPVASRTRVSVSFVGYRVPLTQISDCASEVRIDRNSGVWIGGGARRDDDPAADVVAIPGFRPHLLQICSAGAPLAAQQYQVRAIEPGMDRVWNGTKSTAELPSGAHTQRVALNAIGAATAARPWASDRCLKVGAATIPIASIESYVAEHWKSDDRAISRRFRGRLLATKQQLIGPAASGDVFCVDVSSGKPQRCGRRNADPRKLLFAWGEEGRILDRWTALPPLGSSVCDCATKAPIPGLRDAVEIPAVDVRADTVLSEKQRRSFPGINVRMVSRRFNATVADISVGHAGNRFSPAPFRLGTTRQLRFARSESDLLIFVDEPTVQIRLDDLYGNAPVDSLPQGDFDVLFGGLREGQALIVDLAAEAEEFLPKPIFSQWISRLSMVPDAPQYLERSSGALPRTHRMGEIATFGSDGAVVRPLVLVERIVPPRETWLLPLIAAFLFIVPLLDAARTGRPAGHEWDLAAIVFALLTFRWMLATRALLDDPQTAARRADWSLCGSLLLLTPILIVIAQPFLQRFWQRASGSALKPRMLWPIAHASAALSGSAVLVWIIASNGTVKSTAMAAAYVVFAIGSSVVAVIVALEVHRILRRFPRPAPTPAAPAPAAAPEPSQAPVVSPVSTTPTNRWAERLARQKKRRPAWKPKWTLSAGAAGKPFGFSSLAGWSRESWLTLAVITGILLIVTRLVAMGMGAQEEILTVRIDVFFLPIVAAGFALLSRDARRPEGERLVAIIVFAVMALLGVGFLVNDLGLLWIGGMAMVLALPFISSRPTAAALLALLMFAVGFLSPKFARDPFIYALRALGGTTVVGSADHPPLSFNDELQVQRDRDYYRMLDTVQSDLVETIPSQLAREVIVDRERVRFQATSGAWRAGFRQIEVPGNDIWGAGYLRSKPIIGQRTFRDAARSDYVYPLYVRSEFGWSGLLALTALYAVLFVVSVFPSGTKRRPARIAVWVLAIAAGTALFMMGGTSGLFPFSGKWPLFMSFASKSDLALGLALILLGLPEEDA